jgi:hypothetical protein
MTRITVGHNESSHYSLAKIDPLWFCPWKSPGLSSFILTSYHYSFLLYSRLSFQSLCFNFVEQDIERIWHYIPSWRIWSCRGWSNGLRSRFFNVDVWIIPNSVCALTPDVEAYSATKPIRSQRLWIPTFNYTSRVIVQHHHLKSLQRLCVKSFMEGSLILEILYGGKP